MLPSEALRQKFVKFAERATAVEKNTPRRTSPARAAVFATVKTFCTILPTRRPRVFSHVSSTIEAIARKFWRFSPTLYGPSDPNHGGHGPNVPIFQIQSEAEKNGMRTAVNLANAMATAAIVAVCMTSSMVQP